MKPPLRKILERVHGIGKGWGAAKGGHNVRLTLECGHTIIVNHSKMPKGKKARCPKCVRIRKLLG
jgi:hypothetical protein